MHLQGLYSHHDDQDDHPHHDNQDDHPHHDDQDDHSSQDDQDYHPHQVSDAGCEAQREILHDLSCLSR